MPRHSVRKPSRPPVLPRVDGRPSRALTSLNLRAEEKALFDHLHSWWSLRQGRSLRQADAFIILLALAMSNPAADVPEGLVRQ